MSGALLSIESSCDETACALVDLSKVKSGSKLQESILGEIVSSQVELHKDYGGVVPELASREHIRNLPIIFSELLKKTNSNINDIQSLCVTAGPGLKGCLLVGASFAKGLAFARGTKVYPINHLEGHILSGFYNCSINQIIEKLPALALLVSGGHTQIIYIENIGQYRVLANTHDDAAGEAFDKIGAVLGLGYPSGPILSKRAKEGKLEYDLPIPVANVDNIFSFSGLKTAASLIIKKKLPDYTKEIEREIFINDFCKSIENTIVKILIFKLRVWLETLCKNKNDIKSLILCGGVACNNFLRSETKNLTDEFGLEFLLPPPNLCSDNASMIAMAGLLRNNFLKNEFINNAFEIKARWPIDEI